MLGSIIFSHTITIKQKTARKAVKFSQSSMYIYVTKSKPDFIIFYACFQTALGDFARPFICMPQTYHNRFYVYYSIRASRQSAYYIPFQ